MCGIKLFKSHPEWVALILLAERGLDVVCEVMERYEQKAAEKAIARSNVDSIKYMITTFGATEKQILGNKNYSQKEYNTALKELADEGKTL